MARWAFLLLVAGCGASVDVPTDPPTGGGKGDDGSGSGSGPPPPPPAQLKADDFLEQLGGVQCGHAFLCRAEFPPDFGTFEDSFGVDEAECQLIADAFYLPEATEESVDEGRIVYSAAAAVQCLAGVTFPATCAEYWQVGPTFPTICDATLIGTIPDGGACTIDFDCVNLSSLCTNGTCAP